MGIENRSYLTYVKKYTLKYYQLTTKVDLMVSDIDDNFPDEVSESSVEDNSDDTNLKGTSLSEKAAQEQAQKNLLARKRIDELREKKRLKDLLDDSEDW